MAVAAAYQLSLTPAKAIGAMVTNHHLGANTVYTKDYLDPGGPYDRLFDKLSFGLLRFPGGTVTEERFAPGGEEVARFFDISRPSGFGDAGQSRIVTAPAFFDYATTKDVPIKFVLPTENYFGKSLDEDGFRAPSQFGLYEILRYADNIIRGAYGEVEIETFVIGNEFWYKKERQTPEEYGKIANDVTIGLNRVFAQFAQSEDAPDGWTAPQIGIQVAQGWRPEQNTAILKELSPEARDGIDVLIQHFYPSFYHQVKNSPGTFDRLDDFRDAEGFGDLKYYISEWNTSGREDADAGLLQASTLLEIMRMMLARDVDYASIWGTQYLNLPNRLSALTKDSDDPSGFRAELTPAGELFRMISPGLVGTRVLDLDTPRNLRDQLSKSPDDRPEESRDQLVMHAFQGEDRTVVFLSSRTDTGMRVELDYKDLVPKFTHLWGQKLSVIDDPDTALDEGDPTSAFAKPYVTSMTRDAMLRGDALDLEIGPYEIIRLEFTTSGAGVTMRGHDQMVDPAANYDDTLIGGAGNDFIQDFFGNNLLRGGAGNDTLIGGIGNDTLRGGDGDDLLIGRGGVNEIYGGSGNDTLIGSDEGGFMQGGAGGVNHFVVSIHGNTIVEGFRPDEGSVLSFFRAYDRIEDVRDTLDIDGKDIVLRHAGGTTRLVDAAQRIDDFDASLADFQQSSPVHAILDELLAEQPDGTPVTDPDAPPAAEGPLSDDEFYDLLDVGNGADLQAKLALLTPEQISAFADTLNPTIYAYAASQDVFVTLMNHLDGETLDAFFARMAPDSIGAKMAEIHTGPDVPEAFVALNDAALLHWLDNIGTQSGEAFAAELSDQARETLELRLEEMGQSAEAYDWLYGEGVANDGRFVFVQADPFTPDNAEQLEASRIEEEEQLQRDEQEQIALAGGGCFIATVAYADPFHSDVVYLRRFREKYLRPYRLGRAFIAAYNFGGPILAWILRPHPRGRRVVRGMLSRFVAWQTAREERNLRKEWL